MNLFLCGIAESCLIFLFKGLFANLNSSLSEFATGRILSLDSVYNFDKDSS